MKKIKAVGDWLGATVGQKAVTWSRKEKPLRAIGRLQTLERLIPSQPVERELLRLRHSAFRERGEAASSSLPGFADGNASIANNIHKGQLRTTTLEELTLARVIQDISEQGCVWVKGFLPLHSREYFRDAIDRTLSDKHVYDDSRTGTRWYEPFTGIEDQKQRKELQRQRAAMGHYPTSVFMADSPPSFSAWIEIIRKTGLGDLVTRFIGQRPALSLSKTVLRRQPPMERCGGWHQDGAFLGANVKTLNVWIALTDCGEDAAGLDVLPRHIGLLPTGTEGAHFKWSISDELVREKYPNEIIRPRFEAGDALFFDQFFLHRTASDSRMTRNRYAIESWFFSPDAFPDRYAGFLV